MLLPSHSQHDHDLLNSADYYPWASGSRECDWCGKLGACGCEADPDGAFEDTFEDDDDFFDLVDEYGVSW
jgi:hypothetical protein